MQLRFRTLVVGYDLRRILISYTLTGVAFAGTYGFLEAMSVLGIFLNQQTWLILILGGLVPGLAAVQAYFNAGLLPSIVLGAMPFLAFRLWWYFSGRCWLCPESTTVILHQGAVQTLYLAIPFAVLGFIIGMVVGIVTGP
jgi:hypothetical protein